MGKVVEKPKKKKGRPSLLDLQKRNLKQQQEEELRRKQLEQQQLRRSHKVQNPNPNNTPSSVRRSTRRNPNPDSGDEDAGIDAVDDDGDQSIGRRRKEKKIKLVSKLPDSSVNSDSLNSGSDLDPEDENNATTSLKKRRIVAIADRSGQRKDDKVGEKQGGGGSTNPTSTKQAKQLFAYSSCVLGFLWFLREHGGARATSESGGRRSARGLRRWQVSLLLWVSPLMGKTPSLLGEGLHLPDCRFLFSDGISSLRLAVPLLPSCFLSASDLRGFACGGSVGFGLGRSAVWVLPTPMVPSVLSPSGFLYSFLFLFIPAASPLRSGGFPRLRMHVQFMASSPLFLGRCWLNSSSSLEVPFGIAGMTVWEFPRSAVVDLMLHVAPSPFWCHRLCYISSLLGLVLISFGVFVFVFMSSGFGFVVCFCWFLLRLAMFHGLRRTAPAFSIESITVAVSNSLKATTVFGSLVAGIVLRNPFSAELCLVPLALVGNSTLVFKGPWSLVLCLGLFWFVSVFLLLLYVVMLCCNLC